MVPAARLLWFWLAVALLVFAAPFAPLARWLALAGGAALVVAALADALVSRALLAEVLVVPARGCVRTVPGREVVLAWEIRQQPPRRRRILLALAAAGVEAETVLHLPPPVLVAVPPLAASAWSCPLTAARRGVYYGLRLGLACASRWGLWQCRDRRLAPVELCVHPDWRAGRKVVLSSPLYRLVAGAQRRPLTGPGREFERLRDYLPGDSYADLSWKATARRHFPVSRVYQWEQRQDLVLCLDHARLSALAAEGRTAASVLDVFVETALAAALACHELGDQLGLAAFAAAVTRALPAAHGGAHLARCRELLAELRAAPATADYAALAAFLRAGVRRRSWVLVLTALGEPGQDEELLRVLAPVGATHVVSVLGLVPPQTAPLAACARPAASLDEIYARLAGQREFRRLAELRRQFALRGLALALEPAARFARAGVDAYFEQKRRQAL